MCLLWLETVKIRFIIHSYNFRKVLYMDRDKDDWEKIIEDRKKRKYELRLYVSGATEHSRHAISNLKKIIEENLQDRYDLEIIDIYQQPEKAKQAQIIATPTLIKKLPLPIRKFIGDLSDTESILVGLELKEKEEE